VTLLSVAPSEIEHESGASVKGVATAIVTQNKDEEGLCRVKVRFPWHDEPLQSHWARLGAPMAGKERGFVAIPEVGDEVLVAFEKDQLCHPYVLGALWSREDRPPENNKDGKNDKRIWKSRKKHFLKFDDGSKGVVELAHQKGRKIVFDDAGFTVQDEKGNVVKVDSDSGAMTIEAKGRLNIKAASVTIESSGTLEIKAGATITIRGSLVNIN